MREPRDLFAAMFDAAVAAADPARIIGQFLPARPKGRVVVVGAGKASAQMAAAFEAAWDGPLEGVVATPYGYGCPCGAIEVLEAGHPLPDRAGLEAARRMIDAVGGLTAEDLVVALVSGGGSALLPAPPPGLSLADEIALNEALLASGAPIAAMNAVRKHLSTIKGGRLALAAYPARVASLIVSDIPGDDPALVASGLTVADRLGRQDALSAIAAYGITLPDAVMRHLASATADAPSPDDPRLAGNSVQVIASAARSLEAAARLARDRGFEATILSDAIQGEAREVAAEQAAIAREMAARMHATGTPRVLLSGGETTVTIARNCRAGEGGRNTEFLLAFALAIDGERHIRAFAADTDGIDGRGGHAGAFADGATASRMRAAGIDPANALASHDSRAAFAAVGDLFSPGPTGTNVNDLRIVRIG